MRDRSFRDAQQTHQPAASALDRRHDGAALQREGAEGLRPARQDLRGLPRQVAGHGDLPRTFAAFSCILAQQQISPESINAAIAALRFFFTVTFERPDLVRPLTTVNKPRKVPVVLSQRRRYHARRLARWSESVGLRTSS